MRGRLDGAAGYGLELLIFLVAAAALFGYLALAGWSLGFPLDDGWIHQTYARNLAATGRWEFVPGVASAGSTSPLWTAWLAAGYWLGVPYTTWTHLSGGICLLGTGLASMQLWRVGFPSRVHVAWLLGLLVVGSWPLVWAAGSGMETLLFAALGLSLLAVYLTWCKADAVSTRYLIAAAVMTGLLVLVRPDGLVLLMLLLLSLAWKSLREKRWSSLFLFGLFVLLPLLPYFLFNYHLSGVIWPNTLYAKQTEYAALLQTPLPERGARLLWFSLGGPERGAAGMSAAHLLLLPGILVASWMLLLRDWHQRQVRYSIPLFWAVGHVALYAWRLPVTYQHGRYLLVVFPVWIVLGLGGWLMLLHWLDEIQLGQMTAGWLGRRVGGGVLAILWLYFLLAGGQQYALDVAFIEGEMVTIAHWLQDNTPEGSVIAAHDIGAIGYFARRPLLDLAGLISPEIIPLLDDPDDMAAYVLHSRADYLVTAPGWPYEEVVEGVALTPLFQTDHAWTIEQGVNNMAVYPLPAAESGR